jgi:hypothetical protein
MSARVHSNRLLAVQKWALMSGESHNNRLFGRAKVSFEHTESHSNRLFNWVLMLARVTKNVSLGVH